MKHQAFRPIAMMLSVLLIVVTTMPVQASTVQLSDVVQVIPDGQGRTRGAELQLRSIIQSGPVAGIASTAADGAQSGRSTTSTATKTDIAQSGLSTSTGPSQTGPSNVETIQTGDLSGTICDCGEIFIPGGAFPKLPFLALAPLAFIPLFTGGKERQNMPPTTIITVPTPTPVIPTPTPPPSSVPEPTTVLLLGTGLLALGSGARRRRRARKDGEAVAATMGEV